MGGGSCENVPAEGQEGLKAVALPLYLPKRFGLQKATGSQPL
jgi:hypothetical protein